jgi:acyl-CoA thioesterase
MDDLTTITTPVAVSEGRYRWDVPEGWEQGRGAYGGLVLACMVRAIEHAAGTPDRTLRSLTSILGGVVPAGQATILVEPLRIGNGMSTLAARLVQDGEVKTHAVAILGRPRIGEDLGIGAQRQVAAPWRDVPTYELQPPMAPIFTRNMEYRPTGPLPFSGHDQPMTHGWVRPKTPGPARDGAFLVAMADTWWPAIFSTLPTPRPTATVAFSIDVVGPWEGLDPSSPLFISERVVAGRDGYLVEFRELVGEDGRLLALNQQTVAVIK